MHCATVIDLAAARARRGIPLPPPRPAPEPAFALGQAVTVLGNPLHYGGVALIVPCQRTGDVLYTIQTPAGRIVCREVRLLSGGRDGA